MLAGSRGPPWVPGHPGGHRPGCPGQPPV